VSLTFHNIYPQKTSYNITIFFLKNIDALARCNFSAKGCTLWDFKRYFL